MTRNQYDEQPYSTQEVWDFSAFLAIGRPGTVVMCADDFLAVSLRGGVAADEVTVRRVEFVAHCPACQQKCTFMPFRGFELRPETAGLLCLVLGCRNCRNGKRMYFVEYGERVSLSEDQEVRRVKLHWAHPTPLDDESDELRHKLDGDLLNYYVSGRRAEEAQLGLGAFTYYRRVVEGIKDHLFDRIIQVAQQEETHAALIAQLTEAKGHRQFEASFKEIKGSLPRRLLVGDMSPISLLNTALSNGIHAHSDAECLEYAGYIRTVLSHLVNRLDELLKEDDSHVLAAVKRLHSKNLESRKRPDGSVE